MSQKSSNVPECIPGVYFRPATNSFRVFGEEWPMIADSVKDASGDEWLLVSRRLVDWMSGRLEAAFRRPEVDDNDLSEAILKFYRVRECLETGAVP